MRALRCGSAIFVAGAGNREVVSCGRGECRCDIESCAVVTSTYPVVKWILGKAGLPHVPAASPSCFPQKHPFQEHNFMCMEPQISMAITIFDL